MRVGYAKIGRTINLPPAKWGEVGGDNEPPVLLNKLARRHPEHTFVLLGRNSGECPQDIGFPANVENPFPSIRDEWLSWCRGNSAPMTPEQMARTEPGLHGLMRPFYEKLDAIILWAGQHGTSNARIPKIRKKNDTGPAEFTKPQDAFVYYAGYHIAGVNLFREMHPERREVWLVPDVRNYLKGRDLKNPPGHILGQYDFTKREKHYRYGDTRSPEELGFADATWSESDVWVALHRYEYAQLETVGIPSNIECSYDWDGRDSFGIVINEARGYVKLNRLDAMRLWVVPLRPTWVAGTWSADSQAILGLGEIRPVPWYAQWDKLRTVRSTFTTPSSGSGWATTKPWEAFAVGTVCFFHPAYDDQGHIIPTTADLDRGAWSSDPDLHQLARWLRTDTPEQLAQRVQAVNQDRDTWLWLVTQQRRLFDGATEGQRCITEIERRAGL